MADSIGTVTVDVGMAEKAMSEFREYWARAMGQSIVGGHTVRLDDDSIDRLATAIADKLRGC